MCDYVLFRFKNIMTLALGPASQKPATKDPQSKYETARDYKNHLKGVSQDRELEEWFQDCLRCLLIFISWQDLILTLFFVHYLKPQSPTQHLHCFWEAQSPLDKDGDALTIHWESWKGKG